jgi:hypothetical protein
VDAARGIVRMEFLGGKFLYAMRVVSHGVFNLCPSEVCNPADGGNAHCALPEQAPAKSRPRRWRPARRSWRRAVWTSAASNIWKQTAG